MIESALKLMSRNAKIKTLANDWKFIPRLLAWTVVILNLCEIPIATAMQQADTDNWYSIEFEGKGVGYEHVRTHLIENSNPPKWSCLRKTQIQLKRMGQDFSLNASLWTEQLQGGQLLAFKLERIDSDKRRLTRDGILDKSSNVMQISELRTGSRRNYKVDTGVTVYSPIVSTWMPGIVGPTQRRTTTPVFFPEADGAANIVSEYRASQKIQHGGREVAVTRQNFYSDGDPSKLTTLCISPDGKVLRQEKQVFGGVLAIVEATADVAFQAASHSIDLDSQALVAVDRLVRFTTTRNTIRLKLSVSAGFIPAIPNSRFQKVEESNETEAIIAISFPELASRTVMPVASRQHPALAPSALIPLQDVTLQKMATKAAGPESDPLRICKRLEDFVGKNMSRSSFSTAIVAADEVARTLRGDCTEHAVLLAALMRIKGVPARVVSGLIQTHNQYGFQGHTWVEALLDKEWIPFDSTAGRQVPRIKLAHSELPDSANGGISLFLPVLELAGRAQLRVVDDDEGQRRN